MVRVSVNPRRFRTLQSGQADTGPVIYWMSRDQRVGDNWALLFAQDMALDRRVPLVVVFTLTQRFLDATIRQYGFMLTGLREVESGLKRFRIPFVLLLGRPGRTLAAFIRSIKGGTLVTDFSPLRIARRWKKEVIATTDLPVYEVDAHNIVPCWEASEKKEFAARTIRPKIKRRLSEFLTEIPPPKVHEVRWKGRKLPKADWDSVKRNLRVNRSVQEVHWLKPGAKAARRRLDHFLKARLSRYDADRNDPNQQVQSNLSPYLHFGQTSAQRVALEVQAAAAETPSQEAFLEELIVRRELSDNFCYYEPDYDSAAGFPAWARRTLEEHRRDEREFLYTANQFENAATHDELWNAAQREMVTTGKMHGYMRMYWAKKILEWTESPEEALDVAIKLNDTYELDGRDPSGYTGVAWSIGGVHDRPWFERPVFGKVRYMNARGCARKFAVAHYIERAGRPAAEVNR